MKLSFFKARSVGFAAVEAVIVIPLLLGMAALAVDLGHHYENKAFIQNASDAAALEGANRKITFMATEVQTAIDFATPVANGDQDSEKDVRVTKPMNKIQAWANVNTMKPGLDILVDDQARQEAIDLVNEWNRLAADVEIIVTNGVQGEDCSDGRDNDGDGKTDCRDEDCFTDPACMPRDGP